MGCSSGTGQPICFRCRKCGGFWIDIRLTGGKRKLPTGGYGRSSEHAREYVCRCGHIGWSRHTDLERLEKRGRGEA
jgi:hypothetical protein